MRITPRDLAVLIDRLQVLCGRPTMISEGRRFTAITGVGLPVEVLKGIVEAARGAPAPEASPLLRPQRRPEN